jgi:hypothetical protein
MNKLRIVLAVATLLFARAALAQEDLNGQGHAVVTVLPAKGGEPTPSISPLNLEVKVDGRPAEVTSFAPLKGADGRVELVVLMDSGARESLGEQLGDIANFIKEAPRNTKIAIAYMQNGAAVFASPLSADPAQVDRGLHLPAGTPGESASPYFCLSDLAKNWPSNDTGARREVVMITDGVDNYERGFDPEDPYVQAAITDSVRARLVVYAMYWSSQGRFNATHRDAESNIGQNLMIQVTQATGGYSYWEGMGNPLSFQPYFQDLRQRLRSQYALNFAVQLRGKPGVESMNIKGGVKGAKLVAPQMVFVGPPNGGITSSTVAVPRKQ